MRRGLAWVVLILGLLAFSAQAAWAQEGVSIDAEVGVGGYLTTDSGNPVTVSVTARILTVGTLEVTLGGTTMVTQIEVPAGTTKIYHFVIPPSNENASFTTILIRDNNGDVVESTRVTGRVAHEGILTGVVGDSALVSAVGNLSATPFDMDVIAVPVDDAVLANSFDALDYLIVQRRVDGSSAERIQQWVEDGGRIIGTAVGIEALGLLPPNGESERIGHGTVTVDPLIVDDGSLVDLTITSVPPASFGFGFNEPLNEIDSALFEAASVGSQADELGFGWLSIALVVYVVVAGPLNFLVLSRLGKRDWAWVTIPVLGLAGMIIFAALGNSTTEGTRVRHASVMITDDLDTRAETGLMLIASGEGIQEIAMVEPADLIPFDVARWFGGGGGSTDARIVVDGQGDAAVSFQLATLGVGSVRARWEPAPIAVEVSAEAVVNDSRYTFAPWGIKTADGVRIGSGILSAGDSTALEDVPAAQFVGGGFEGSTIADAIFSHGFAGNGRDGESIWPLSWAASQMDRSLLGSGTYFGYTDDYGVEVVINGSTRVAEGNTLVIVAIGPEVGAAGSASAKLLSAPGADHIEQYGETWVYGADSVAIQFLLPDQAGPKLTLTDRFGPGFGRASRVEVYDWASEEFREIQPREPFASDGRVSPFGEVMIQIVYPEFGSEEVLIASLQLSWDAR